MTYTMNGRSVPNLSKPQNDSPLGIRRSSNKYTNVFGETRVKVRAAIARTPVARPDPKEYSIKRLMTESLLLSPDRLVCSKYARTQAIEMSVKAVTALTAR